MRVENVFIKYLGLFFIIRLAAKMDCVNVCMEISTDKWTASSPKEICLGELFV